MRRWAIIGCCAVGLLLSGTGLTGCGSAPCVELATKACAATDEKNCLLYTDSLGGESPSESQNKACAVVLEDPQTLDGLLTLLRKRAGK